MNLIRLTPAKGVLLRTTALHTYLDCRPPQKESHNPNLCHRRLIPIRIYFATTKKKTRPTMFSATTLSRFAVLAAVFLAQSHVDACGALPQCKTFREIYGGGKQLCENMWGDAFKYETNEDEGFGSYRNSAFDIYCSVSGNMCQHKPCCSSSRYLSLALYKRLCLRICS